VGESVHLTETMDVTQGKLCMGFVTPVTNRTPEFAAMQVMNTVFGGGMTSKLFMNVREKLSLCYDIGSGYVGAKGILTVSAGIDSSKITQVRGEIMNQLAACQRGDITQEELEAARQMLCSGMRSVYDSIGSIERYYSNGALSGASLTPEEYVEAIGSATLEDVVAAANTVKLHTVYFLQGVSQ
jgi:predicted Zn-dependent peptidase